MKSEPVEYDNSDFIENETFFNERFSLDDILTNTYNDIDLNIDDKAHFLNIPDEQLFLLDGYEPVRQNDTLKQAEFNVESIFNKIITRPAQNESKRVENNNLLNKRVHQQSRHHLQSHSTRPRHNRESSQQHHQQQVLLNNNETFSSTIISTTVDAIEALKCDYDYLNVNDEELILNELNKLFNNDEKLKLLNSGLKFALARYRCKLNLRKLKRLKRLKQFDIDTYTNELIDCERSAYNYRPNTSGDCVSVVPGDTTEDRKSVKHLQISINDYNDHSINGNSANNGTLNNSHSNDIEIIAVYRVLDRFSKHGSKNLNQYEYSINLSYKLGLIEFRSDDIKCVVSPYTKK